MSRRSFINLISNTLHLPDLDYAPILDLLNRQFPIETLLSCLHEVTHHWSFDSPIGLAQSLLFTDAMEAMLQSATDQAQSLIARDRFVRFSVVDAVLDPLYEGLALFAEQNLVSLDSEAASPPFVLMGMHHGIAPNEQFFDQLSTLLVRCRRTITNAKRKTEVLCLPGDPSRSPYLSGYMTVLACFYRAASQTPALRDPDLFLMYFKTFFFDDLEFATVLLSFELAPEEYAERVFNYVRMRLLLFMTMDHSRDAAEIEQMLLLRKVEIQGSPGGDPIADDFTNIANIPEGRRIGRDLLNGKVRALMTQSSFSDEFNFRPILAHMIANRSFMRLLCRRVWIKNWKGLPLLFETEQDWSEADREANVKAIPLQTEDVLPDGPAFLECLCVRNSSAFVLRKANGSEPGKVLTILGSTFEETLNFPQFSHSTFDGWARVVDPLLPTRDGRDSEHVLKMNNVIQTSTRRLFDVFSTAVMFHHDHRHPISQEFLQDGFLGVLADRSLVKASAYISILSFQCIPDHLKIEDLTEFWEWIMSTGEITRDFEEAVRELIRIRELTGWKLIAPVNDRFALTLNF